MKNRKFIFTMAVLTLLISISVLSCQTYESFAKTANETSFD